MVYFAYIYGSIPVDLEKIKQHLSHRIHVVFTYMKGETWPHEQGGNVGKYFLHGSFGYGNCFMVYVPAFMAILHYI